MILHLIIKAATGFLLTSYLLPTLIYRRYNSTLSLNSKVIIQLYACPLLHWLSMVKNDVNQGDSGFPFGMKYQLWIVGSTTGGVPSIYDKL